MMYFPEEKNSHSIKGDPGITKMIKLAEKRVKMAIVRKEPLTHLMT